MASVYNTDSNIYRPLVARYDAFSSKGTGWATESPGLRLLGSAGSNFYSVAGFVSPLGDLLATFAGSTTGTRLFGKDGWETPSGFPPEIEGSSTTLDDTLGYGHLSDFTWDGETGYFVYRDESTNDLIIRKFEGGEWQTLDTPDSGDPEVVTATYNGYVPITVWEDDGELKSAAPVLDPDGTFDDSDWPGATLTAVPSTTHIDAASDDRGNTVVVFLDDLDPLPTCSTEADPPFGDSDDDEDYCKTRVFGMVRNVLGAWAGPTVLDDDFTVENTLHFDETSDEDFHQWSYPRVVYLSDGVFLLVFSITDAVARTSGVYSKTYTVGTGWSAGYDTIIEEDLEGDDEHYRMAKRLNLVTD
ncbi:MAG: hypothetical protein L0Z49_06030, partial [Actinobacteria bacterium]|nr:hypothetical protein [Actinomycetota bacterium]